MLDSCSCRQEKLSVIGTKKIHSCVCITEVGLKYINLAEAKGDAPGKFIIYFKHKLVTIVTLSLRSTEN